MQLITTIEIDPWDYCKREYEPPEVSREENPKESSVFWYKCISDSNLQNLKPVEPGSYLVDVNDIKDRELKIILEKELYDIDLSDYKEYVGEIIGGVVVKNNNRVIIEPSCCGGLSDIKSWEEIRNIQQNIWTQLWIGHPWLFYKKIMVIFYSLFSDYNLDDFKDISAKHILPEHILLDEIKTIRICIDRFEKQISKVLKEMSIDNANEIAKLMVGNR